MSVIWKFNLALEPQQTVRMPRYSKPLSVQVQGESICLWAECDEERPVVDYHVQIVGTGYAPPEDWQSNYIGTVQQGAFVWHVYISKSWTGV